MSFSPAVTFLVMLSDRLEVSAVSNLFPISLSFVSICLYVSWSRDSISCFFDGGGGGILMRGVHGCFFSFLDKIRTWEEFVKWLLVLWGDWAIPVSVCFWHTSAKVPCVVTNSAKLIQVVVTNQDFLIRDHCVVTICTKLIQVVVTNRDFLIQWYGVTRSTLHMLPRHMYCSFQFMFRYDWGWRVDIPMAIPTWRWESICVIISHLQFLKSKTKFDSW